MGKLNNGVFLKVVGDQQSRPQWEQFYQESYNTDLDSEFGLAKLLQLYKKQVEHIKNDLQELADAEVIILQIRALLNLVGNVKLYTVKDKYIYARTNFYRMDSEINELRILIDPIDLHFPEGETDLQMLSGNQEFMDKVYYKMRMSMYDTLRENVDNFSKIYPKKN